MMKAGAANYAVPESSGENNGARKATPNFRTTPFPDRIFTLPVSLFPYTNPCLEPLSPIRKINEGKTRFQEKMYVVTPATNRTKVGMQRQSAARAAFDTTLRSDCAGHDLPGVFALLRTPDCPNPEHHHPFCISNFV